MHPAYPAVLLIQEYTAIYQWGAYINTHIYTYIHTYTRYMCTDRDTHIDIIEHRYAVCVQVVFAHTHNKGMYTYVYMDVYTYLCHKGITP